MKSISILISHKIINEHICLWWQRRESSDDLSGLLEFPGGKVEAGETSEEACIREVQEETGVELSVKQIELFKHFEFEGLNLAVFLYNDTNKAFSERGYISLENSLEGKNEILPNNMTILSSLKAYFKSKNYPNQA